MRFFCFRENMSPSVTGVFLLLLNCFNLFESIDISNDKCYRAKNCRECLRVSPECQWCSSEKFDDAIYGPGFRCATKERLEQRNCDKINTLNSKKTDNVTAVIRPDSNVTFYIDYIANQKHPVDIYYLTDVSFTMRENIDAVSAMSKRIYEAMARKTSAFRMGLGTFSDKRIQPFVESDTQRSTSCKNKLKAADRCTVAYSYQHNLNFTRSFTEFARTLNRTKLSENQDDPESQLDALFQIGHCKQTIEWAREARKIVLISSDGDFHVAGDGKLASLIEQPPDKCMLVSDANGVLSYAESTKYDYPSMGKVVSVLESESINLIFATKPNYLDIYEAMRSVFRSMEVGVMQNDSSNIVELIERNYEKIVQRVKLVALQRDEDDNESEKRAKLDVQIWTKCPESPEFELDKECSKTPNNAKIQYKIVVKMQKCPKSSSSGAVSPQNIQLKVLGLTQPVASLQITPICECTACEEADRKSISATTTKVSAKCSNRGSLVCGACDCSNSGFSGDFCECAGESGKPAVSNHQCRAASFVGALRGGGEGGGPICSNHGRCSCGKCKCFDTRRFQGELCDCDRDACPRASDPGNAVCGRDMGRGQCMCNKQCRCNDGYTQEACDCLANDLNCRPPSATSATSSASSNSSCSGNGVCQCGVCYCNALYMGKYCEELRGARGKLCGKFKRCVLCMRNLEWAATNNRAAGGAGGATNGSSASDDITRRQFAAAASGNINTSSAALLANTVMQLRGVESDPTDCREACRDTDDIRYSKVQMVREEEGGETGGDKQQQQQWGILCLVEDSQNCNVFFSYKIEEKYVSARKYELRIQEKRSCKQKINYFYIILFTMLGVIAIGMIILFIWKLIVTIDDRRELARFDKENKNCQWEMEENPTYKDPYTRVLNPHFQDN